MSSKLIGKFHEAEQAYFLSNMTSENGPFEEYEKISFELAVEFGEWLNRKCKKLSNDKWCLKLVDDRDQKNHITTEKAFEIFKHQRGY